MENNGRNEPKTTEQRLIDAGFTSEDFATPAWPTVEEAKAAKVAAKIADLMAKLEALSGMDVRFVARTADLLAANAKRSAAIRAAAQAEAKAARVAAVGTWGTVFVDSKRLAKALGGALEGQRSSVVVKAIRGSRLKVANENGFTVWIGDGDFFMGRH